MMPSRYCDACLREPKPIVTEQRPRQQRPGRCANRRGSGTGRRTAPCSAALETAHVTRSTSHSQLGAEPEPVQDVAGEPLHEPGQRHADDQHDADQRELSRSRSLPTKKLGWSVAGSWNTTAWGASRIAESQPSPVQRTPARPSSPTASAASSTSEMEIPVFTLTEQPRQRLLDRGDQVLLRLRGDPGDVPDDRRQERMLGSAPRETRRRVTPPACCPPSRRCSVPAWVTTWV